MAFTFQSSTTAGNSVASLSCAYPAGIASGDFLLVEWACGTAAGTLTGEPSGFTLDESHTLVNRQLRLYSRIADGTETGSITFTKSAAANQVITISRFTVDSPPYSEASFRASGTAQTAATAPALTVAGSNDLIVRAYAVQGSGGVVTSPATLRAQFTNGTGVAGVRSSLTTAVQAIAGTTGTLDATWGIAADWLALTVAYQEGAGPATQTIEPPAIASGATLYAPALTPGSISLVLPEIAAGETLYSPTLALGSVSLSPPVLASGAILYPPVVPMPISGSLYAALGRAWASLGLDVTVGPLYLNQVPRNVMPDYVVVREIARRNQKNAGRHYIQTVRCLLSLTARGEANALAKGTLVNELLHLAALEESRDGTVIQVNVTGQELDRDPAGWLNNSPIATNALDVSVTLVRPRANSIPT